MLLDMLQLLYLQRADWTSRYLVIWHAGSTAFPFYPKRGLKIQSSSARRHVHSINFVSFFHEEWVENSTLPLLLDTLTVFHFLRRAEYLTCRLDSIFFCPKRGLEKSRPLLPVNVYLAFRFFFLKSALKICTSFTSRYVDRCFICLKSGLKIQLYRGFLPLDMWTGCFFLRVAEKHPALHNLSRCSKRRQCLLFCDSTRLFMWSVPGLWFSHFVPCALVCVSNPVPKGIFILFCRLTFKQSFACLIQKQGAGAPWLVSCQRRH